ncbi:MAG: radical SAM protein [Thermoplasmata archaeon]
MLEDKEIDGVKIVLTSSPSEMSDYGNDPFKAFIAAFPSGIIPRKKLKNEFFFRYDNPDGTAKFAQYGLRKVESLLLSRFPKEDVAVVHPDNLDKFVGKRTKVVGITTMDPMGLAYVSTTYSSIFGFGGESINSYEFKKLINHPSIKKYKPKIIVGGSGAWQIDEAGYIDKYGIDSIVLGEAEKNVIDIFEKAVKGEKLERVIKCTRPDPSEIPLIVHPALYGVVEITRGCGRNCKFCSPTMRHKYSFPIDWIMKEVEVNIKQGSEMIFTNTEDMFLYKSKENFIPNREEVVKLYSTIAKYPGVKYIQLSHASLAPVVYDPKLIEELTPILMEKTRWTPDYNKDYRNPFITVEVGIETGSVRLMEKYMRGKALPYDIKNWQEIVTQAIGIMNDYDWYPLATIMTGLPDETEEDTLQTLELLDKLKDAKMFFTPILFIPLKDCMLSKERRVELKFLNELQWDFIATCWKNNIDFWMPRVKRKVLFGSIFAYLAYYRWKHGPKMWNPILKLSGLNETFIGRRIFKGCDYRYCSSERDGEFKPTLKQYEPTEKMPKRKRVKPKPSWRLHS